MIWRSVQVDEGVVGPGGGGGGGEGPDKFLPLWGLWKNPCIRDALEYGLLK